MVRAKPPLPALHGLFGQADDRQQRAVVCRCTIDPLRRSARLCRIWRRPFPRYLPFQLGGNVRRGGLVELPFGHTLARIDRRIRRRHANGRPVRRAGRRSARRLSAGKPARHALDYEAFADRRHARPWRRRRFDDTVDMAKQARSLSNSARRKLRQVYALPHRRGARRRDDGPDRCRRRARKNLVVLDDLAQLMTDGSLCAMGGLTPMPVKARCVIFRRFSGAAATNGLPE